MLNTLRFQGITINQESYARHTTLLIDGSTSQQRIEKLMQAAKTFAEPVATLEKQTGSRIDLEIKVMEWSKLYDPPFTTAPKTRTGLPLHDQVLFSIRKGNRGPRTGYIYTGDVPYRRFFDRLPLSRVLSSFLEGGLARYRELTRTTPYWQEFKRPELLIQRALARVSSSLA